MPVEVHEPELTPLQLARTVLVPLVEPLATVGIVFVVLIFILLQREDLRDRMIRLFGSDDLHRTTAAMDDAARRLSRYFLIQLALNASFGVMIAIGLWAIGVPSPLLWGIFAALMRFVPYIGSFIAGALPVALAAAVDPGWTMALLTLALFVVSEPIMGPRHRAAGLWPEHRTVALRGRVVRDLLDLAVGTGRPAHRDAPDALPRRARPPRGAPRVPRRAARRPAGPDSGREPLSAHARGRSRRGARICRAAPEGALADLLL